MRDYVTRREYDDWINECAALAIACGYPVQDSMINDSTGLVLGTISTRPSSTACGRVSHSRSSPSSSR